MITVNFSPFPELTTERTFLRKLDIADKPAIFQLRSDERVMRYIARRKMEHPDEAGRLIERLITAADTNDSISWAMVSKGDTNLIGTLCLWNISEQDMRAEIGYDLMPEFQGRGLMQEAMDAVLNYGFTIMNLHTIEAFINAENQASINLVKRKKFVREAYFKENVFFDGKFQSSVIYTLHNPNH